jgi:hypothetical protein
MEVDRALSFCLSRISKQTFFGVSEPLRKFRVGEDLGQKAQW